jgi:hypothetical protein
MRFRGPESIVEEIRRDVRLWDFRSFAFSGPMFGADPQRAFHLADLLGRLPFRIEFSLATRPGLVPPEMLRALHRLGLACVALDLQTPGEARPGPDDMPLHDDAAAALIEACRGMGIRTVAKFVVGHPTDPIEAVRGAFDRAGRLNPTFVEFHLLTRYPGADSLGQSGRFEVDDLSRHTRQRAVLRYECLGGDELERARDDGLRRFYFRRAYFRENLHLLWSGFPRFGADPARRKAAGTGADAAHAAPPRPTPGPGAYGRTRMLRSDGPHIQPGISEDHREPMPPVAL